MGRFKKTNSNNNGQVLIEFIFLLLIFTSFTVAFNRLGQLHDKKSDYYKFSKKSGDKNE